MTVALVYSLFRGLLGQPRTIDGIEAGAHEELLKLLRSLARKCKTAGGKNRRAGRKWRRIVAFGPGLVDGPPWYPIQTTDLSETISGYGTSMDWFYSSESIGACLSSCDLLKIAIKLPISLHANTTKQPKHYALFKFLVCYTLSSAAIEC